MRIRGFNLEHTGALWEHFLSLLIKLIFFWLQINELMVAALYLFAEQQCR